MLDSKAYYSRQTCLPEVGSAGQIKLSQGKCLVVGAGGLGSSALYYLAAAGVGTLGICDGDHVDITNLHRQILFTSQEVGRLKAICAADRLSQLNPLIRIIVHAERLTSQNCKEIVSHYDLILDCTDNFQTKFLLNDASYLFNIPLIQSSIYRFEGQLRVYLPQTNEACLRCLWPEQPADGCVGNCAEVGVLGPLPGFFGVLQAMEAIKFFLHLPLLNPNQLMIYDLLTHSQKKMTVQKNPDCPLCSRSSTITKLSSKPSWEIDAKTFSPTHFQLVDIREKDEVLNDPLLSFPSLHFPLSSFDINFLDPNKTYLFFCQKGFRSRNLVAALQDTGWKKAYSLIGGIQTIKNNF